MILANSHEYILFQFEKNFLSKGWKNYSMQTLIK